MSDDKRKPKVEREIHETGIRLPAGRVVTGANIPDVRFPDEVIVTRTRTVYADHVTEWMSAAELHATLTEDTP